MEYYPEAELRLLKFSALFFTLAVLLWPVAMATNSSWDAGHPAPVWEEFVFTVAGGLFLPKSLLNPDADFPLRLAPLLAACLGYTLASLTAWVAPALRLPGKPLLALKLLSIFHLVPLIALYRVLNDKSPPSGPGDLLWLLTSALFLTATWLAPVRVAGEPFLSLTVLYRDFARKPILRPPPPTAARGFLVSVPHPTSPIRKPDNTPRRPAYRTYLALLAFVTGSIIWWIAVYTPAGWTTDHLRVQPATTGLFIASELNDAINPFSSPRSSAFNHHPPALPMLLYFITLALLWLPFFQRKAPFIWTIRVSALSLLTPAYYLLHPTFNSPNTSEPGLGFVYWTVANLILATTPWLIPATAPDTSDAYR